MYPVLFHTDKNERAKVLNSFKRTEKSAIEDVNVIKEWLKTQKHLPELMEDVKIGNFLLLNKHSIEKTKQKIDMYYTIKSVIPEIFENSNPKSSTMTHFMDTFYCCVHPRPVDGIYRMYFLKAKQTGQFAPRQLGLQCSNISEVRLYEDCMAGEIIVFDMSTITVSDLTKITPSLLAKLLGIYEKVYSLRVKAAYVINSPSYVVNLTAMLKSVIKPKIFQRIQVCKDCEILKGLFSVGELPKDYGGDGPSLEELNEMTKLKLGQYQDRFDLLDKLKVDENLRPQKLKNDQFLGFHGNFKQLNVD